MYKVADIEFTITRKRGLKHTYIYVKDDIVEVRASYFVTKRKIFDFVSSKSLWIKKQKQSLTLKPKFNNLDQKELKIKAKELIDPLVKKYSHIMQVTPTFIGYRYNKTRWGSCSGKNRINFNTKLALMPYEFIEYVVVHELAHIRHKNHSIEFWNEVEKYLSDYKIRKKLYL